MLDGYGGLDATGKRITFKVQTKDVDGLRHHDAIAINGFNHSVVGINAIGDGRLSELVLKQTAFVSPTTGDELVEAQETGVETAEAIAQYRAVYRIDELFYSLPFINVWT